MSSTPVPTAFKWAVGTLGAAAGAYAGYAAMTWLRYGTVPPSDDGDVDHALDHVMPLYDIVERHHIEVAAPAEITFATACEMDLMSLPVVHAIIKARELLLGSKPGALPHPRGLLALTKAIGWGVLAEVPGREVVMGAVTQPWKADVTFTPLPPDQFAAFLEPGYVKIAWTLRADPAGPGRSIFRTETRAMATDAEARSQFRRYWSLLSPGITLIRRATLRPLRHVAGRRYAASRLSDDASVFAASRST